MGMKRWHIVSIKMKQMRTTEISTPVTLMQGSVIFNNPKANGGGRKRLWLDSLLSLNHLVHHGVKVSHSKLNMTWTIDKTTTTTTTDKTKELTPIHDSTLVVSAHNDSLIVLSVFGNTGVLRIVIWHHIFTHSYCVRGVKMFVLNFNSASKVCNLISLMCRRKSIHHI